MFFPTPGYFTLPTLPNYEASTTTYPYITVKVKQENEKQKLQREDKQYDNSPYTSIIKFKEGNVTFTRHFKYLGSFILYNLRDDHDVDSRIASASASMGGLSSYWSDKPVDLKSKYLIFMEIPCNLLLWGSESLALRTSLLSNLGVFLHRSVRRILGIKMTEMKEERIRNSEVRERLFNIPTIQNQIVKCQLTFIGNVVRNSDLKLPTTSASGLCHIHKALQVPWKLYLL